METTFHNSYHSLEDIYSFGDALAAGFDGKRGVRVEAFTVGETFEGREIRGWKAWYEPVEGTPEFKKKKKGKKGKGGKGKKPDEGDSGVELEFVVQSGQHAREVGLACGSLSILTF
jgi:extracellular matrix protein 14